MSGRLDDNMWSVIIIIIIINQFLALISVFYNHSQGHYPRPSLREDNGYMHSILSFIFIASL